jgi:hypothetical protein
MGLPALRVVGVERVGFDTARLCGGMPLSRLQRAGWAYPSLDRCGAGMRFCVCAVAHTAMAGSSRWGLVVALGLDYLAELTCMVTQ